jgi:hypothetical protein
MISTKYVPIKTQININKFPYCPEGAVEKKG